MGAVCQEFIQVEETRGNGRDESDPIRIVTAFYSKDGARLAEFDREAPGWMMGRFVCGPRTRLEIPMPPMLSTRPSLLGERPTPRDGAGTVMAPNRIHRGTAGEIGTMLAAGQDAQAGMKEAKETIEQLQAEIRSMEPFVDFVRAERRRLSAFGQFIRKLGKRHVAQA